MKKYTNNTMGRNFRARWGEGGIPSACLPACSPQPACLPAIHPPLKIAMSHFSTFFHTRATLGHIVISIVL